MCHFIFNQIETIYFVVQTAIEEVDSNGKLSQAIVDVEQTPTSKKSYKRSSDVLEEDDCVELGETQASTTKDSKKTCED